MKIRYTPLTNKIKDKVGDLRKIFRLRLLRLTDENFPNFSMIQILQLAIFHCVLCFKTCVNWLEKRKSHNVLIFKLSHVIFSGTLKLQKVTQLSQQKVGQRTSCGVASYTGSFLSIEPPLFERVRRYYYATVQKQRQL